MQQRDKTRRTLFLTLSLLAAAAAFWFVLRHVNLKAAIAALQDASPFWIVAAAFVNVLTILMQGERLYGLVKTVGNVSHRTAAEAVSIGFASSQFLPARGGEVIKLTHISRNSKIRSSSLVGLITLENVINGLGLLLVATIVVLIGNAPAWVTRLTVAGSILLPIILLAIYNVRPTTIDPEAGRVWGKLQAFRNNLHAGFAPIRRPRVFLRALLVTAFAWALELATTWCTLMAFHMEPGLLMPLLLMLGVNAAILLPITPGHIGVYEIAGAFVLQQLGMETSASLMIALIYHLVHMFPTLALATMFMVWRQLRPATAV